LEDLILVISIHVKIVKKRKVTGKELAILVLYLIVMENKNNHNICNIWVVKDKKDHIKKMTIKNIMIKIKNVLIFVIQKLMVLNTNAVKHVMLGQKEKKVVQNGVLKDVVDA